MVGRSAILVAAMWLACATAAAQPGPKHLGFGAVPCRNFNQGLGQMAMGEMRQYVLGYLAGVDPDIFRIAESNDVLGDQQQIYRTVVTHVVDYCSDFPNASVGDGMMLLRASIESNRWHRYQQGR